ncbi:MAG: hypothetical protein HC865_19055 [Cyanobacteria bacterium RU_5_0]|nr:hypothetical protein [Cyanobacteria bacterium RU_5_0]
MKLIYRGHTYNHTPVIKPYVKARIINWRYCVSAETYTQMHMMIPQPRIQPRTINWRYQMAAIDYVR